MKSICLISDEIDEETSDHMFFLGMLTHHAVWGPRGLVADLGRELGVPREDLEKLADDLFHFGHRVPNTSYEFRPEDLLLLKRIILYTRDVYEVQTELHSVTGYDMDQLEATLAWIEAVLTSPD